MNQSERDYHNNFIDRLLNSDNPKREMSELNKMGSKFITSTMIKLIDERMQNKSTEKNKLDVFSKRIIETKPELKDEYKYIIAQLKDEYLKLKSLKELIKADKTPPKEKLKFIELFRDPDNAKKVIDILKTKGYLNEDYNWIGLNGNKTELLAAYYSLREKGILQSAKISPQALSFYNYFGLKIPEYMDKRNFTTTPSSEYIKEFDVIFSSIN